VDPCQSRYGGSRQCGVLPQIPNRPSDCAANLNVAHSDVALESGLAHVSPPALLLGSVLAGLAVNQTGLNADLSGDAGSIRP